MASQPKHPTISKAKARLLLEHPFFATLLLRTQITVTEDPSIPLAATNGESIFYDKAFLGKCSVEDVMTVLCHEVGHDSLLHSIRLGQRNADMWNQACDHAINLMLIDQGLNCPKVLSDGWLADPQYKGWSADRIYDDLRRKKHQDGGAGQGGKGNKGKPGGSGQGGKNGRDSMHGDVLPSPKKGDDLAAAAQKAKQRVASAATMARMAGKLKGDLARMVDDMLESKVHWTDVLREFMTRIVRARDNWSRRNRRFPGTYLPTRRSHEMGPILFIPDTSGSMMGDDMEKICSEMAHCAVQTRPENIRVIWADAKVQGEQVFSADEFSYKALKPVGGGGTDMRVPLEHAKQYDPQVVVLCTDCYTPWPDQELPFPVICISTTKAPCPDWMQRIEI